MISNPVRSYARFSLKGTLNVAIMTKLNHFLKIHCQPWSGETKSWAPYEYPSEKNMRQYQKRRAKEDEETKGYGDYNWEELYKSGNLKKLKAAEVNKYISRHNLSRRKMSKSEKTSVSSHQQRFMWKDLDIECCWNCSNGRLGHPGASSFQLLKLELFCYSTYWWESTISLQNSQWMDCICIPPYTHYVYRRTYVWMTNINCSLRTEHIS